VSLCTGGKTGDWPVMPFFQEEKTFLFNDAWMWLRPKPKEGERRCEEFGKEEESRSDKHSPSAVRADWPREEKKGEPSNTHSIIEKKTRGSYLDGKERGVTCCKKEDERCRFCSWGRGEGEGRKARLLDTAREGEKKSPANSPTLLTGRKEKKISDLSEKEKGKLTTRRNDAASGSKPRRRKKTAVISCYSSAEKEEEENRYMRSRRERKKKGNLCLWRRSRRCRGLSPSGQQHDAQGEGEAISSSHREKGSAIRDELCPWGKVENSAPEKENRAADKIRAGEKKKGKSEAYPGRKKGVARAIYPQSGKNDGRREERN